MVGFKTYGDEYVFDYNNETKQQHVGSSEAIAVFKTVLVDFNKHIISQNKNLIFWTADKTEKSRLKLYNTLSKLLQNNNYVRITDYDLLTKYLDVDSTQYNKITNKIRLINKNLDSILYVFVKKNSNIIPLDEVRNPSKPSDKFKFVSNDHDPGGETYFYRSIDKNIGGTYDELYIIFSKSKDDSVSILFVLNMELVQSPEYAHLAMAVFQTVLYQVTQYVNKYNPKVLKFSATSTESSRISLYKRICKNITGYTVEESRGNFTLTREE